MKLKLMILTLLLLNSCKAQDPKIEINNIISSLKENKNPEEKKTLDKSLKIVKISAVREKMNNPILYDMKLSIEEIFLKTIKNKTYSDILEFSIEFTKKKKERIKYLENEIEKQRLSSENNHELVRAIQMKIDKNDEYEYGEPFISIQFNNLKPEINKYVYHIEIFNNTNQEVLQIIGFGNKIESGVLNTNDNSFIIKELISKKTVDQINNFGDIQYPINDLTMFNLGIKSYASELTADYVNNGKPLKEDDLNTPKTIEELKKDLMKLKLLIANIEN